MTQRERILAVYRGEHPDAVPYMLDLSHWFYHRHRLPWDISRAYDQPESDLIRYHRQVGAGFYMPNLGTFYATTYPADVQLQTVKHDADGTPEIRWRIKSARGEIERRRRWEEHTYAWGISRWGIQSEPDLRVFGDAMSRRTFAPQWDRYHAWVGEVGDNGVVYLPAGYSALGYLLHYWMGVEAVAYAVADYPQTLREVVDSINANNLQLIDLLATAPAEIIILGDNLSSDVQPPSFFAEWSGPYYREAIRRLHAAGKFVAVHIDGKLRGAIRMVRETGADCGDAITPKPFGDLTATQCRNEAGPDFVLSGGVSPDLWLPRVPVDAFAAAVRDWLGQRRQSPRLIAGAGDQVPPGAAADRIHLMRELVEKEGRY